MQMNAMPIDSMLVVQCVNPAQDHDPVLCGSVGYTSLDHDFDFDFIECFTTTFLRAHSWLNWVDEDDDEDEVGLKEKPEDTRYIKKITSK